MKLSFISQLRKFGLSIGERAFFEIDADWLVRRRSGQPGSHQLYYLR